MPFRSEAQRRKFAKLRREGKISEATWQEWQNSTGDRRLPERVAKKATKRRKRG